MLETGYKFTTIAGIPDTTPPRLLHFHPKIGATDASYRRATIELVVSERVTISGFMKLTPQPYPDKKRPLPADAVEILSRIQLIYFNNHENYPSS